MVGTVGVHTVRQPEGGEGKLFRVRPSVFWPSALQSGGGAAEPRREDGGEGARPGPSSLRPPRYFLIERGKNMCGLAACASYPIPLV